ncbi:MAG: aminotransferase class V-fold PLP-dependent enzyme [Gammaproteobacteria bacterium]
MQEFPQSHNLIYLNHAAVSPWPKRTTEAVKHFAEENLYQGASHYARWLETEALLRRQLQRLINAPSSNDIALLKNTSEALSVVACGLDWHAGDSVVSSDEEFPSNRIPWQAQAQHGVSFKEVDIRQDAPEQALMAACDRKTRVLAISSVQYSSGIRLDLAQLGNFCQENDILFCVDAIQSLGAHQLDVQGIHADFVMADAHKWMLGPEGVSLFYAKANVREQLTLRQYGWHMVENRDFDARAWQAAASAQRFECGSPNMLGIHALSASLSLLEEIGMAQIERNIINNISYLFDKLKNIDGLQFLTPEQKGRYAGIISFTLERTKIPEIHRKLLKNKVICAQRGGGIRFSPHFYTDQKLLDKAVDILYSII